MMAFICHTRKMVATSTSSVVLLTKLISSSVLRLDGWLLRAVFCRCEDHHFHSHRFIPKANQFGSFHHFTNISMCGCKGPDDFFEVPQSGRGCSICGQFTTFSESASIPGRILAKVECLLVKSCSLCRQDPGSC